MSSASAGSDPLQGRAGTGGGVSQRDGEADRIAQVVFALLVLACFAALIVTQRLKHTPTAVQAFKMTNVLEPAAAGELKEEHISFKLAKADRVTVTIVGSSGEEVATLVSNLQVARYKQLSLRWNGRKGTARGYTVLRRRNGYRTLVPANRGAPAPAGEYSVRVSLQEQDRSVPSPRSFKLVRP